MNIHNIYVCIAKEAVKICRILDSQARSLMYDLHLEIDSEDR